MKTKILFAVILAISGLTAVAHPQHKNDKGDRTEWYKEMGKYKAEFLASELKLTDEQKKNFLQVYMEMENSSAKMARETRQLEKQVRQKGEAATDLELEKAAEARAEFKAKQGALEKEYFEKFKKILTPRQLFMLGDADKAFGRKIMESNRKHRDKR